jgi:hypothetical protein
MSVIRTVGGWGIVLLGALILFIGYVMSVSTSIKFGNANPVVVGTQMEQIGFMLIIAGFGAWIIVSLLRKYRII